MSAYHSADYLRAEVARLRAVIASLKAELATRPQPRAAHTCSECGSTEHNVRRCPDARREGATS